MSGSKFSGLLKRPTEDVEEETPAQPAAAPASAPPAPTPTRQTATGKRSDPAYTQVSAYVRKDTLKRVKRLLIDEEQDFGELVEELLQGWATEQEAN